MNFEHTEDRRMLADSLGRLLREQYAFETRERIAASPEGWSREHWARIAELGAIGMLFGEADGGYGGSGFDIALVFEQLGRGARASSPSSARCWSAAPSPPPAATRSAIRWARSSPAAASPRWRTRSPTRSTTRRGSARARSAAATAGCSTAPRRWWRRPKRPICCWSARAPRARPTPKPASRCSSCRPRRAGVSMRGYPLIDGGRAAEVTLSAGRGRRRRAARASRARAYAVLERAVGAGLRRACAESVGAMDAAKEATLEYLRTRKQFGVPIGSFQALQHRMADVLLEVEQARSAVINAAAALDEPDRAKRERALSAAKVTIGRVGTLVAEECDPAARRHRHDLGAAAGALRQAAGDDRPPPRRRGPPPASATSHSAAPERPTPNGAPTDETRHGSAHNRRESLALLAHGPRQLRPRRRPGRASRSRWSCPTPPAAAPTRWRA